MSTTLPLLRFSRHLGLVPFPRLQSLQQRFFSEQSEPKRLTLETVHKSIEEMKRINAETLKHFGTEVVEDHEGITLKLPFDHPTDPPGFRKVIFQGENNFTSEPPLQGAGTFGLRTLDKGSKEVTITNDDFDAMTIYQHCGMPAISISNHSTFPSELKNKLAKFEMVYLWLKQDTVSQMLARSIANELGPFRCVNIYKPLLKFQPTLATPNQAMLDGFRLPQILSDSRESMVRLKKRIGSRVLGFDSIQEHVINEILNPQPGTKSLNFPGLNKIIKGHRPGELTVFTGATGVGKTSFLSQLSLDFCSQGVPTLWGSFEIRHTVLARKMLSQFSQKALPTTAAGLKSLTTQFSKLPLQFLDFFGSVKIDELLSALAYSVEHHGTQHIILDNLQFMMSDTFMRGDVNKFDAQDRAIHHIRKFANDHNVHISLVIHPKKQEPGALLATESIYGTSKSTQEADNVFILQRTPEYNYLQVTKNRYDGDLGTVPLRFDKISHRYIEMTSVEEKRAKDLATQRHKSE